VTDGALHVESQRVRWWVHLVVAVALGGAVAGVLARAGGEQPLWVIVLPVAIVAAVYGLLNPMTVRVTATDLRVEFGHFGWPRWRFAMEEIRDAQVIEFSALRDWGGWGIRTRRGGLCLNERGNTGVQFTHRGRTIVVGSDDPHRLLDALRTAGADAAAYR